MADEPIAPSHPLDERDEAECYEVMMKERTVLLTAKRDAEDELIRTVVKLSSAALLLIPGLVISSKAHIPLGWSRALLLSGVVFFILSLLAAMAEQRFSSLAYEKQVEVLQNYYGRNSSDIDHKPSARKVQRAATAAFGLFITAVLTSSIGLVIAGATTPMSQEPEPHPPVYIPDHKSDVPGRSVPPAAPPPPPPPRRG